MPEPQPNTDRGLFAATLVKLRWAKSMSQRELQAMLEQKLAATGGGTEVGPTTISLWERGLRSTRLLKKRAHWISIIDDILEAKGELVASLENNANNKYPEVATRTWADGPHTEKIGQILRIGKILPEGIEPAVAIHAANQVSKWCTVSKSLTDEELKDLLQVAISSSKREILENTKTQIQTPA